MNKSLILVDGMNIANRAMVTQQIATRLADVVVHECNDKTPAYEYVNMMRDALENHRNVIIENGWRAEYVLDMVGEKTSIPVPVRRMLDRIALGCCAEVAYCMANSRIYAENVVRAGMQYADMHSVVEGMHTSYEKFIEGSSLRVSRINTSDAGLILDIDVLMDKIDYLPQANPGPGIGMWKPTEVALLVGDRHGPSLQPYKIDANLAFCDMAKPGSSYWLTQKMHEAGIAEEKLYWINAYDKNNLATGKEFVEVLRPISILTLGDSAASWAEKHSLRYEPFSHPQFHKRFHYNEPYPLIERLKEIFK